MSLPWNRREPDDADDSWLTRIPVVGLLSTPSESDGTAERSAPRRVADAAPARVDGARATTEGVQRPGADGAERTGEEREITARP